MSRFVVSHRRLYRLVPSRKRTNKEWSAEQSNASPQPPERQDCTPRQDAPKPRYGKSIASGNPARNAKDESRRINVATGEHQRCPDAFEHTAGNRNPGPAQRRLRARRAGFLLLKTALAF